jgi:hypothetical protein
MNRKIIATRPQSGALGTPMAVRPRPEGRIQNQLRQEKPAQASARVVKRGRGALEIIASSQPYETVPQILALEKKKYQKNDNDAGGREWRHQRLQHCHEGFRRRRVRLMHFHRNGYFGLRTVRKRRFRGKTVPVLRIQFPIEIFQQVRGVCEQSGAADGVADIAYLFTQGGLITGKVVGQLVDLDHDHCGQTKCYDESRADRAHHRQGPGDFKAL